MNNFRNEESPNRKVEAFVIQWFQYHKVLSGKRNS